MLSVTENGVDARQNQRDVKFRKGVWLARVLPLCFVDIHFFNIEKMPI